MIDGLPTLAQGSHEPDEGKACVMEYVSLLAGEPWSDHPVCTHPTLSRVARNVNDSLYDKERHLLVPLIGRLFGTDDISPEVSTGLARHASKDADNDLANLARLTRAAYPDVVANYSASIVGEAFHNTFYPHYINYRPQAMVDFLSSLIDEYDRLTGRTEHRVLTPADYAQLQEALMIGDDQ